MSLSKPFFNKPTKPNRPLFTPVISEEEYQQLHWTRQLEIRPFRERRRWVNNVEVDFDTYIDMFDDNEIVDKETK